MTLICEDGSGVQGAESYASVALITTYWANRPQAAYAAAWTAATSDKQEGAAREATAYLDATWGNYYRGYRRGYVQGLLWPRTGAFDDAKGSDGRGYPLPDLPACLQAAVAELAGRAISARLAPDLKRGGMIDTLKAGSVEIQYAAGAPGRTTYGVVALLLAPILNGSQPDAPNPNFAWA